MLGQTVPYQPITLKYLTRSGTFGVYLAPFVFCAMRTPLAWRFLKLVYGMRLTTQGAFTTRSRGIHKVFTSFHYGSYRFSTKNQYVTRREKFCYSI